MKVHHIISRSVKAPDVGKIYGARVEDIRLNGGSVTLVWAIFARKPRKKKAKDRGEVK